MEGTGAPRRERPSAPAERAPRGHATGRFRGALDVTLDLPLASLGTRALAQVVDAGVLFLAFATLLAGWTLAGGGLSWVFAALLIAMFLLEWGYFAAFELFMHGQTPGKRLLRLRVVTEDGTPAGVIAVLVRNLIRHVDLMPPFYGIGSLTILATSRGQRLGDLAAGTLVVREPDPVPSLAIRRWPAGFTTDDVALMEAYFERSHTLPPVRSRLLARRLLDWLATSFPEFVGGAERVAMPETRLVELFSPPPAGQDRGAGDAVTGAAREHGER
ncbi:MAG: RDD family protein [Acidobacteriota bacterium]|nr:RDD family protein [Acidobacteriota bacterium]